MADAPENSLEAFRKALAAGATGLTVLDGGLTAWQAAGQPVDSTPAAAKWEMDRQVRLVAGSLVLAGIADSVSSVFRNTILQSATPDAMRGRLHGVFIVVVAGGPRLGDMVAGGQAAWLGEGWTAVVGGIACAVLVLAVAGGEMTSIITADAAREMGLKKGDTAAALVKSTDIMIERV